MQAAIKYGVFVLMTDMAWRDRCIDINWSGYQPMLGTFNNTGLCKWRSPYLFKSKLEETVRLMRAALGLSAAGQGQGTVLGGEQAAGEGQVAAAQHFDPQLLYTNYSNCPNLAIEPSPAEGGHAGMAAEAAAAQDGHTATIRNLEERVSMLTELLMAQVPMQPEQQQQLAALFQQQQQQASGMPVVQQVQQQQQPIGACTAELQADEAGQPGAE